MMRISRREALTALTSCSVSVAICATSPLTETLVQSTGVQGRAELPPIDAKGLAHQVVKLLGPSAGERAILVHDPTYYPELTDFIYGYLREAGVHPVVAMTFEPPENQTRVADPLEAVRALASNTVNSQKIEAEVVGMLKPLFEQADIFLWLPARHTWPDLRWERLVGASQVRSIHFHWIAAPDGRSAEEIQLLTQIYQRAVLETDYSRISALQETLINKMRGQPIQITSRDGTDLRMLVPHDAWFHKNDGDMSLASARKGKTVRDREMEVPVGALRFVPDSTSVAGRLVLGGINTRAGMAEGVELIFERGYVTTVRAKRNEEGLRQEFKAVGGDVDKVGEIVIGTNPLLRKALPSGELPYFGYGAGYIRISLGDNWESGGTNRSPLGRPLWFLLTEASLEAGSISLVQEGHLTR